MKKILISMIFSPLITLQTQAADNPPFKCESSWVFHQYKECDDPQHPIEVVDESVKCPGDSRCVPVYFSCQDASHGVNNTAEAITHIGPLTIESDWIEGLNGDQQKDFCIAKMNEYNNNPQNKALGNFSESGIVNSKKEQKKVDMLRQVRYKYFCELDINRYPFAEKRSKACPVESWEPPKVNTGYEKHRDASCGTEEKAQVMPPGNFEELLALKADPKTIKCLTCEHLDFEAVTAYEVADCLTEISEDIMNSNVILTDADKTALAARASVVQDQVKEYGRPLSLRKTEVINNLQNLR